MKLIEGIIYFPSLFTESQCPTCLKILQWTEIERGSKFEARCCDKIFHASVNYVSIKIEDTKKIEIQANKEI